MYIAMCLILGLVAGIDFVRYAQLRRRNAKRILATGLLVAALIYIAFAFRAANVSLWLKIEVVGVSLYGALGLLGIRGSAWWLVAGWGLHPVWDVAIHYFSWCRMQESNPRPTAYKAVALPTELIRLLFNYMISIYFFALRRRASVTVGKQSDESSKRRNITLLRGCHPSGATPYWAKPGVHAGLSLNLKETLNKLIPFVVRPFDKLTAHHERNQQLTVRPELVEGLIQRSPRPASDTTSLR